MRFAAFLLCKSDGKPPLFFFARISHAAKNNGLFEVKERTGRHNDWAGTQTLITPKGRETFRLLCKEPPVLPQFTAL